MTKNRGERHASPSPSLKQNPPHFQSGYWARIALIESAHQSHGTFASPELIFASNSSTASQIQAGTAARIACQLAVIWLRSLSEIAPPLIPKSICESVLMDFDSLKKVQNLHVIDIISEFIKESNLDELYSDENEYGGHPNEIGNKLISKIIQNYLTKQNLLSN